jgi:hypothetical protein
MGMESRYRLGKRLALAVAVVLLCAPLVAGKGSRSSGCKKSSKKVDYEQPAPAGTATESASPSPAPTQ